MCLQSRHWGSTQAACLYFGHLQVRVSPGNQSTSPGVCACVQAINSPSYAISYHYNVSLQSGCSDINRYNEFTCAYVQVTQRSVQGANLAYDPTHYCLSLSVFVEHLLKSRQCLQDGAEHELQYRQCRLMQSAGTCSSGECTAASGIFALKVCRTHRCFSPLPQRHRTAAQQMGLYSRFKHSTQESAP